MAPNKTAPAAAPTASRQLVVAKNTNHDAGDSRALIPFSGKRPGPGVMSRELILYAKEHGGELVLSRNITGPEKLRIKAEMLSSAVRAPFNLGEASKIAESQLNQQLGNIERLRDSESFYDDMMRTIEARIALRPQGPSLKKTISNAVAVASAVGTRIHNVYFVAGSWKQAVLLLKELQSLVPDLQPGNFQEQFKSKKTKFRDTYVLLYRQMVALVGILQKNLALAAAASKYYGHYFLAIQSAWMAFRREEAMGAMKSLINTIVMELVFPQSNYPLHILFAALSESLDENPGEVVRFSQDLFDAIGDLGDAVQLLDVLEAPLTGEWAYLRDAIPPYTPAFDAYLDAEYFSIQAMENISPDCVFPLEQTKYPAFFAKMWAEVDKEYTEASGYNIDRTWQLEQERNREPQWFYVFSKADVPFDDAVSDISDDQAEHALVLHKDRKKLPKDGKGGDSARQGALVKHKKGATKRKALTQAGELGHDSDADYDSDMPGLLPASESSDNDVSDDSELDNWDGESGYDSEEEEELDRLFEEMIHEALDAMDDDDDDDDKTSSPKKEVSPRSKNPFIKLVKQLGGRLFSLDPTLNSQKPHGRDRELVKAATASSGKKATSRASASKPTVAKPGHGPPPLHYIRSVDPKRDPAIPPLEVIAPKPKETSHKTTLEEVEDEGEKGQKKKRIRKPKKKPSEAETQPSAPTTNATHSPSIVQSNVKLKEKRPTPSIASAKDLAEYQQAWSLSLHQPTQATSSRVYLATEGLVDSKSKKKTKTTASIQEEREPPTKEGFGAKVSKLFKDKDKDKDKKEPKDKKKEDVGDRNGEGTKPTTPFNVGSRVKKVMGKLFGCKDEALGSMKWDHFVKAMKAMGFVYEPQAAGSRVRFVPPGSEDRSIVFHKPHPDSTLHPELLREFRKRLQRQYGWTEDNFADFDRSAADAADAADDLEEVD